MAFKNVMIDIEGLGRAPKGVVLSIGAVGFDRDNGIAPPQDRLHVTIRIEDQLRRGSTVLGDTVLWWGEQSRAAWKAATERPVSPIVACSKLRTYLQAISECSEPWKKSNGVYVWCNGATYDFALLSNLYDTFETQLPWAYSNECCMRTLRYFTRGIVQPPFVGVEHNALDDAVNQALSVIRFMRSMSLAPIQSPDPE